MPRHDLPMLVVAACTAEFQSRVELNKKCCCLKQVALCFLHTGDPLMHKLVL